MQGKGLSGVMTVVLLLWSFPALAYLEPASVIMETIAEQRRDLAFRTVVLEGYTPVERGTVPVWLGVRANRAQRLEIRDPQRTQVELLSARRDLFRFDSGAAPSAPPDRLRAAPFFELLGDSRADPGGQRGQALLARMGVDTEVVSLDRFDGRPVYVLGAGPGDLGRPQLWIDKESYVPVRWLVPNRAAGGLDDVRLLGYRFPTTGPWWPERMEVWRGQSRTRALFFTRARMNVRIDPALFEPPGAGPR